MITVNSRDPISLFSDLSVGWLSGQEPWVDETEGARYYSYANLFTIQWDFSALNKEGSRIFKLCKVSPVDDSPLIRTESTESLETFTLSTCTLNILTKRSGRKEVHVFVNTIDFPRGYLKLIREIQGILYRLQIQPMTPVIIQSTVFYFNRLFIPMLYVLFGRRAFLDIHLVEMLNMDLDRVNYLCSPRNKNKTKRAIWKFIRKYLNDGIL